MFGEFELGTEVVIISLDRCSSRYSSVMIGKTGTITDYYQVGEKNLRGIQIPGMYNENSSTGSYWFPIENLKLKTTKEKTMNIKTFGKDAKFAILVNPAKPHDDGTVGVYYCDLKPGDLVVCDYGYGNGALSARIVEISDREPECVGVVDCEIMGVCDVTEYLDRKTKMERRAELKKQMIVQAKKYQEEEYWRVISESDPAMKALYEEFKELED